MYQPNIDCAYIRIQSDMDHAHDIFCIGHTINMINAAVNGMCPYVRLNAEVPNQILDIFHPELYGWESAYDIYNLIYTRALEASVMTFPGV